MRRSTRRFIGILAPLLAVMLTWPAQGFAADEEESPLAGGQSVRDKVLYRSGRVELSPMLGVTPDDAYVRNLVGGVNVSYHLTNQIGIGLTGLVSPIHPETSLTRNIKRSIDSRDDASPSDLALSYAQWMAGVEFYYVPLFGKLSLMNDAIGYYDVHIIGGMTGIMQGDCEIGSPGSNCAGNPSPETSMAGLKPAGTVGLGFRLFVGDAYAMHLQVRDHLYRRAELAETDGTANPTFSSNFLLSFGFSFFFPQSVEIAR